MCFPPVQAKYLVFRFQLTDNSRNNKVIISVDSMVKCLKANDLVGLKYFVKALTQSGATTKDMLDCMITGIRKKPDTVIIHTSKVQKL